MRWMITAAALVAAVTWTAAITAWIASHPDRSIAVASIYLVNLAVLATIITVGLWLTDRILREFATTRAELRENRALGERLLKELRSEHDQADRALRALLDDDDSNPRIRRLHT